MEWLSFQWLTIGVYGQKIVKPLEDKWNVKLGLGQGTLLEYCKNSKKIFF